MAKSHCTCTGIKSSKEYCVLCVKNIARFASKNTWELEIVIPTFLYTFVCGIFSSPISPFPYHWEVDSPNTYHTLSKCQMIIWCCWEALEEAKDGRCNIELVAGSGERDKTRFREALLEYRLGGSLANPCIPTDCLVDRFPLGLEGGEEVFCRVLRFPLQ